MERLLYLREYKRNSRKKVYCRFCSTFHASQKKSLLTKRKLVCNLLPDADSVNI